MRFAPLRLITWLLVFLVGIGSAPVEATFSRAPFNQHAGETRTTTFAYDFEGRLTTVAAPEGTIHYGYDLVTGRHTSTRTDYTHVEYGYDLLGRLQTVRVLKRNGDPVDETTTYTYTPVGSREATYYPNGVSTHCQYDALNRLTNLTHRAANQSLLAEYSYTLGDTGRRTGATEIILDDDDTTYATNTIAWQYDGLYRLTNETFNGVSTSYEYDLVGNRLEKSDGIDTITYDYNANDQLLSETNGTQVTTYAYDANGSLTNRTATGLSTNAYAYNLANRLASVTTDAGTTSFLYDYQGIRVRSKGAVTKHFLIDHRNPTGYAQVLEEAASLGAAPTRTYTIGDDVLGQCGLSATEPQWLLYDGHGSTRQLLGDAGSVSAQYDFDAYGVATESLQDPLTTRLYAGEQYDPVLEQYYLRARYYNPATGRFNRMDPFAGVNHDPQSLHKYAYAHCDPVNGVDPSGLHSSTIELLGVNAMMNTLPAKLLPAVLTTVKIATAIAAGMAIYAAADEIESLITAMVASASTVAVLSKEFVETIRLRFPRFRIFLHYSRELYATSIALSGLRPMSYVTWALIPSAAVATQLLALPVPCDSVFIALVPRSDPVIGPSLVVPTANPPRTGGGLEWRLPLGTRPGTTIKLSKLLP